ncbi:ABC transporter substrate-binding protein [Emcibacter sp.]|uniref:MlaC/ttg2D family ABC transporter substrate-binding protein n=1 Tax=Emcibacter sp. TaxID=1979954 RepID=UPI002AA6AAE4|nr:ABC transporter substrate-binding protein [Emcibacter sp.]
MKNASKAVAQKNIITRRMAIFAFSSLLLIGAFFYAQSLFAAPEAETTPNQSEEEQAKGKAFVEATSQRALDVLKRKETLSEPEIEDEFRVILTDAFAIDYIGKLVLGRHRKKATKEELKTYNDLFPDFLIKVYASRLTKLDTTQIDIGRVIPHGKKDMFVRSKVLGENNETFDVDWRIRPFNDAGYQIIDVKIEGISMARTQRDDFTSRVSESQMSGLNQYMKNIIDGVEEAEPIDIKKDGETADSDIENNS